MALTRKDFEPILKKYSRGKLKFKPYLRTGISQIVNAKKMYGKGVDSTTIVALFDTTFLKTGKTGYLLTLEALYSSQFGGKEICFSDVKAVEALSGKLQVTYKNGKKAEFPAETYAPQLCLLLQDVIALYNSKNPQPEKAPEQKKAERPKPAKPEPQQTQPAPAGAVFTDTQLEQIKKLNTQLGDIFRKG